MSEYKRIDEDTWRDFGKQLLDKENKGSANQIAFLTACRDGKEPFLAYLRRYKEGAIIGGTGIDIASKLTRFTELEFRCPPRDTQKTIWMVFQSIPKAFTGSCGFWAQIIIDMLITDKITPDYLASDSADEEGAIVLDRDMKSGDSEKIDKRVRRVLRSMCNPAPRGKRIVFYDFSLGQAYWRWQWASKMSGKLSLSSDEILKIFDDTSYAVFAAKMHSGSSYISQSNVLGGLILLLQKDNLKSQKLKSVIDGMSYLSAWQAIECQSPQLNKQAMEKIGS